jgi:hypothetical protein
MLPDRSRELLTAYVDGELTPQQRRQVRRLVQQSTEARDLLRRLEEDAARLRSLSLPALDRDLSAPVVSAIRERHLRPGRRRSSRVGSFPFQQRALFAAAASLMLILGMSYVLFSVSNNEPLASRDLTTGEVKAVLPRSPTHNQRTAKSAEKPPAAPATLGKREEARAEANVKVFVGPSLPEEAALPDGPAEEAPVVTAPSMELFQPERAEVVPLPVILPLLDLDREAGRTKLLEELRKDVAFRIELPCRNATRAFDRVQSALRTRDIGLVVEQRALSRLRQPQWKTNYVIFAEDVTPEDLAALLTEIGRLDRKGKSSEVQLEKCVVTRLSRGHRKELSDLLGVDPVPVTHGLSGPLGTDPHKPLPEVTAAQVARALSSGAGQGTGSRGGTANPAVRQALVLAYNPVRPGRGSAEVRRFLEARRPARDAAVQMLLVLRGI